MSLGPLYVFYCNNSHRGVGRGYWGEGSIGATIKDTRTKPRGRVEVGEGGGTGWGGVEGRGENADNSN